MTQEITIYWLREDLRLSDNAALHAASHGKVIPLYILEETTPFPMGGASKWWLRETLQKLAHDYAELGAPLILKRGDPAKILPALAKETKATRVTWHKRYHPRLRQSDDDLANNLEQAGLTVEQHDGYLLFKPESIRTGGGTPFKVFTPFSKACFAAPSPAKTIPKPKKLESITGITSDTLDDWKLVPRKAIWPKGLADAWPVGEEAAQDQLRAFVKHSLSQYKNGRDRPDQDHTSRLSPHLHFGHISPRQVWHAIQFTVAKYPNITSHAERYLLEILWREFSWHLLYHHPAITDKPLNKSFTHFPWLSPGTEFTAWQKGLTGYPIVDAGMRQLWQTGWMHNRVRMIVASFLIKDLLIDWREGMGWFWDTLVDADLASNTASWQWVAGCGADAAPYFRIFNPTLQGQKFDPNGAYVRHYVPELAALPTKFIHEPWKCPASDLQKAGITLGKTYPNPIIDHNEARKRALEALKDSKSNGEQLPD